MQVNNTKTRTLEAFKPLRQERVKVYYCGPTVYNHAHIGNLRTYMFEDIVVKTLRFLGFKIETLMNFTDIDDKTIKASQEAGVSLKDFTKKYSDIFLEDIAKIGIQKADNIVPISEIIPEMVTMINGLLLNGYAYVGDDQSIYFDISKAKNYGKFANLDFDGMKSSIRIDNDEYEKENAADFVLWKAWKEADGENFWNETFHIPVPQIVTEVVETPVVVDETVKVKKVPVKIETTPLVLKGRPGWHIECSALNNKYFGAQIDLHMGGCDLIFPHHQNEIAQSESYSRKEFCKYWLHSGHLTVDGKKMAKSANNFYTIKDLEEKYSKIDKNLLYRAIRLSFINGKYSDSVDFSFSKLEQGFNTLERIDEMVKNVYLALDKAKEGMFNRDLRETLQVFVADYIECLENDFNTPEALAVFFEFVTFINTNIKTADMHKGEIDAIIEMLKTFNQVLGIINFDFDVNVEVPKEITALLQKRIQAKLDHDFELADSIRAELKTMGYVIIDDRNGSRVERV